jgi:putative IMPACT (imprinted ancient) family translation regulator
MTPYSYKTIESEAEGLYKEKASKFYAFAFPVENEEEIKARLDALRKKYFDARHHCYA